MNIPLPRLVPTELADTEPAGLPVREAALVVAMQSAGRAAEGDNDGAFPAFEIQLLADHGLLHAPLPERHGGDGLGLDASTTAALRDVLRIVGGASLPLGRLYEGHVNAVRLVARYGSEAQLRLLAEEAGAGRISAVWNAELPPGLRYDAATGMLAGAKRYASGAGHVRRPLVTAATPEGPLMLLPDASAADVDLNEWTPLGMRATATGTVDFTGIHIGADAIVGAPGDYYRSPLFAAGAWRVLAVQLGGLEQLLGHYQGQLAQRGRHADPIQRARFGEAAALLETARLWSAQAAGIAEDEAVEPAERDAFVNLARHAFERAALDLIERVQRGIGLSAMLRPNPIERIGRDLATYLRQPFPDAALDAAAGWLLANPRPPHGKAGN